MSISSEDLLAYVENLAMSANCEPSYRNTVSSAYYAVYHKAISFHGSLDTPGVLVNDKIGGVHSQLSQRLINPTVSDDDLSKKSKMAGYICKDMHIKRVDADYDLSKNITPDDAKYGLETVKRFFALLS